MIYFPGGSGAASFTRCRLLLGPVEHPDDSFDQLVHERAVFERFWYLTDEMEGTWRAERKGTLFGAGSIVTSAMVRHVICGPNYPLYLALGRALAAARHATSQGGQLDKQTSAIVGLDTTGIQDRLLYLTRRDEKNNDVPDPAFAYSTAYPHALFHSDKLRIEPGVRTDLLRDVAGPTVEYMADLAFHTVVSGTESALKGVPRARYGDYETVDREEIERINAVRALMLNYRANPNDKRPLSIAVFGQPGSGKSFAIKELAKSLFGDRNPVLEFNLSQFDPHDSQQLHQAFHRVRDASIKGAMPLVFWDEFDSDGLIWLKHFLAPMQDAEFRSGSDIHAFGKAYFIFAGGTKRTFQAFEQMNTKQKGKAFRASKGPDFISRLRGYIDIKGPNPTGGDPHKDPAYVIRRAVILRSSLQRFYPHLIEKQCHVQPNIIRGFLDAKEFKHGARSMQAILGMCQLQNASQFGLAQLNAPALLEMHVSADFTNAVRQAALDLRLFELLAEAAHQAWRTCRETDGWTWGPDRNEQLKHHPMLIDYEKLPEDWKQRNRVTARVIPAKLAEISYEIVRLEAPGVGDTMTAGEHSEMARLEHDRWLREHLIQGYEYHANTTEALRQHKCLAPYQQLSADDQKLDLTLPLVLPDILTKHGFALRKKP
ncbi:MAG: AAA family ATPase [Planctomycetaceae bacterium]|nr:AAA family ATPase [Planctomycetaceae bacterium]